MKKTIFKNASIVQPDRIRRGDVVVSQGIIEAVGEGVRLDEGCHVIDAAGKYLLPGFVDLHTNGCAGFDLTSGVFNPRTGAFDGSPEARRRGISRALDLNLATGCTRAGLTSVAGPLDQILDAFDQAAEYLRSDAANKKVIAGLYVEGTFMKSEAYRGAHNSEYFYPPAIETMETLQAAAEGHIRIVNVVPEHDAPGQALMDHLVAHGVVVAAGHSGATARQYELAMEHGLKLAIHFLNGPTGSSEKPFEGGGAVEAILRAENLFVEIIVDGYHVSPAYVRDTLARKGFERMIAITDNTFLAGMEGVRSFQVSGIRGKVSEDGEYAYVDGVDNTLFGSVVTMDQVFSNLISWLTTDMPGVWHRMHEAMTFEEAIVHASRMCSGNPARVLGIAEPGQSPRAKERAGCTGSIEPGRSADLVVASIDGEAGDYRLEVETVLLRGEEYTAAG